MKKLLKKIRGSWDPTDFYLWHGGFTFLFLMGVVVLIFGKGEQKWAGVFAIGFALDFLIVPHLTK